MELTSISLGFRPVKLYQQFALVGMGQSVTGLQFWMMCSLYFRCGLRTSREALSPLKAFYAKLAVANQDSG